MNCSELKRERSCTQQYILCGFSSCHGGILLQIVLLIGQLHLLHFNQECHLTSHPCSLFEHAEVGAFPSPGMFLVFWGVHGQHIAVNQVVTRADPSSDILIPNPISCFPSFPLPLGTSRATWHSRVRWWCWQRQTPSQT